MHVCVAHTKLISVIRGLCVVYYHVCHRVVIFGSPMCLEVTQEVKIFCVKKIAIDLERAIGGGGAQNPPIAPFEACQKY